MACDRTVAETIETLTDRLQTSTLLDDRRDACRGLRSCAKEYRVEVGAQAMEALLQTIRNDGHDLEITNYCLDCLNYIISGPLADSPAATWPEMEASNDLGRELSEIFLKRAENVATVIETTINTDFKTRWVIVRLLCGLARHKLETVQDSILSDPLNLSRLAQLIDEERDLIRNDALVLFVRLTHTNQNIQNVLAYENFFDKIIHILENENYLDGTVAVIGDCVNVLLNMTQYNETNQILFREGGHIVKLLPFFDSVRSVQATEWVTDKTSCIVQVLQILDAFVSPSNSPENVRRCQDIMQRCGIFDKLCELLSADYLPIGVLAETMNTASNIIKNHLGQNATTVMHTKSIMPLILLGMVKEMCEDQERRIADMNNYMNVIYEFMKSRSSSSTN